MSIIHHVAALGLGRVGDLFDMVAGVDGQTSGWNDGQGVVNLIGSITPADFKGREIFHLHKDNSGLQTTIFQQNAGDIDQFFWSSMIINGVGWNNFEVFSSSRAGIADNNGSFTWTGMDDSGSFFNGQSYSIEWFR